MDAFTNSVPAGGLSRGIGGIVVLILGAIALYYLYQFLYSAQSLQSTSIITDAIKANPPITDKLYSVPPITEGGEYSVSFWVYLTGFKDQVGLNKHVLELRGSSFSTLVVGLGAFTNKLMIRVTTDTRGSSYYSKAAVKSLFTQTQIPGSNLGDEEVPFCDLPEIDLQRWVCITIVLNGKTTDVYYDGKLARSCVSKGFYRVDQSGVNMKLTDQNGFDGFISDVSCYQYALNPEQAYRIYMAGPSDVQSGGFVSWLRSIFNVQGSVTYQYPALGVSFPTAQVNF